MESLLFQTPDVCIWTLLNVPNLHICCFLFHGKCVGVHGAVQLFNLMVTSNHSRLTCSMQHSLSYHFKILSKLAFSRSSYKSHSWQLVHKWQLHDVGASACMQESGFPPARGGQQGTLRNHMLCDHGDASLTALYRRTVLILFTWPPTPPYCNQKWRCTRPGNWG